MSTIRLRYRVAAIAVASSAALGFTAVSSAYAGKPDALTAVGPALASPYAVKGTDTTYLGVQTGDITISVVNKTTGATISPLPEPLGASGFCYSGGFAAGSYWLGLQTDTGQVTMSGAGSTDRFGATCVTRLFTVRPIPGTLSHEVFDYAMTTSKVFGTLAPSPYALRVNAGRFGATTTLTVIDKATGAPLSSLNENVSFRVMCYQPDLYERWGPNVWGDYDWRIRQVVQQVPAATRATSFTFKNDSSSMNKPAKFAWTSGAAKCQAGLWIGTPGTSLPGELAAQVEYDVAG